MLLRGMRAGVSRPVGRQLLLRPARVLPSLQAQRTYQAAFLDRTNPAANSGGTPAVAAGGSAVVAPTPLPDQQADAPAPPHWLRYATLAKWKLSALVLSTTAVGALMVPGTTVLSTLVGVSLGTSLCIASANSFNQWIERDLDRMMVRTRTRPLPAGLLTSGQAVTFATATGLAGVGALALFTNPVTAALGAGNIALYTLVYTPMKRKHWLNTWVGAVVGAVPPVMGWTAAGGSALAAGSVGLFSAMFLWQMPHFLSLAYLIRDDYRLAGYQMLSVQDPRRAAWHTMAWSAALVPTSALFYFGGVVDWTFPVEAAVASSYLAMLGHRFHQDQEKYGRRLFLTALAYLPLYLLLLVIHRRNNTGTGAGGWQLALTQAGARRKQEAAAARVPQIEQ